MLGCVEYLELEVKKIKDLYTCIRGAVSTILAATRETMAKGGKVRED